ncbi:MAG: hypothetical protein ACI835_003232 [Planctomycetota bacterium]|jgi:hypothetical protein
MIADASIRLAMRHFYTTLLLLLFATTSAAQDRCSVRIADDVGYIDATATLVTPAIYDTGGFFHEGSAHVEVGVEPTGNTHDQSDSKHGFIEVHGEQAIDPIYDYAHEF